MRLVVFAGPTLPSDDRSLAPGADWRPPAEAGDILRLDCTPSLTVCLIDGFFDHRPAVRHKEILHALSRGARIVGGASIGALRAAEMAPFGMEGEGSIYRAYAAGRIDGDDEVALVHAGADHDWRPLSVPLVEVRATLCALLRVRGISRETARGAMISARAIHYIDRSWADVAAGDRALQALLEEAHVPQKTIDARAALASALEARPAPPVRPEEATTSFVRALARELDVDLSPRAPDRAG